MRGAGHDVLLAGSERVGIPLALLPAAPPVVTVAHHLASPRKRELLRRAGLVHRWARIGYLTAADARWLEHYFGLSPDRLFRYISAPLDTFTLVDDAPLPAEPLILSVGRSYRDYGTLLAALGELPGYRTEIYSASRYADDDGSALSGPAPAWVRLMPGVSQPELRARYRAASFAVIPLVRSTQFSAGVSAALEAQAAGRAVIASATTGMRDFVVPGVTGLLVPPGDAAALRDAIQHLWTQPELARAMGRAARRYVERHFALDDDLPALQRMFTAVWEEDIARRNA
jgi:glycosyltransferase involved in cell wall biosynthesis